jgi:hypothetical protein
VAYSQPSARKVTKVILQKYTWTYDSMEEDPNGDYVLVDDVLKLLEEYQLKPRTQKKFASLTTTLTFSADVIAFIKGKK